MPYGGVKDSGNLLPGIQHPSLLGMRQKSPNRQRLVSFAIHLMGTKQLERIRMIRLN